MKFIDGILGPGLTGSGADIEVVIPPFGTGAVVFAKGNNVGKIKKLKNNNFGYDYTHDYTLRPEITFPINAQLTSTSILDSITVTDPGSGYSRNLLLLLLVVEVLVLLLRHRSEMEELNRLLLKILEQDILLPQQFL